MHIPLISSLIHYFKHVYEYAGRKLYILLLLFFFGCLSESVGILMLLPILDVDKAVSGQSLFSNP